MSPSPAARAALSAARPTPLRTAAGRVLVLGDEIARGGEAAVHAVAGSPSVVAKVYTAPRAGAADKLRWMRDHPPRERSGVAGHCTIAWPTELLLDGPGACVGYLMPRIDDAVPLLDVMNPRRRARVLPAFDHAYILRTARNLAAAIAALHDCGTVVGDLHERNVLVTRRALVTVIDADSFQVTRAADDAIVIHPCPVGRAEYTPPELQGQAFRTVVRQPSHDAFGLAVLVFQLLHGGSHPFRGRWLAGGEAPSMEEKIRRGWFPWAPPRGVPLAPPPGVAPLAHLDPGVRQAVIACFVGGHDQPASRPSAADWERALGRAEAGLATCSAGHVHPGHLRRCPRCGARRGGWAALWGRSDAPAPKASPRRTASSGAVPARRDAAARAPSGAAPAGSAMAGAAYTGRVTTGAALTGPTTSGSAPTAWAPSGAAGPRRPASPRQPIAAAFAWLGAAPRAAADGAFRLAIALAMAAAAAGATALILQYVALPGAILLAVAATGHAAGTLAAGARNGAPRRPDRAALVELVGTALAGTAALAAGWLGAAALPWLARALAGSPGLVSPWPIFALAGPDSSPAGPSGTAWAVGFGLYGALVGQRAGARGGRRLADLAPNAAAGAAAWLAAWLAAGIAG